MSTPHLSARRAERHMLIGVFALGFAASGFFDGILLHQILQWHHLLSSMTIGVLGSLAGQVMFDGIFHALMYVIGLAGGLAIWRARRRSNVAMSGRRITALFLYGFGVWHVVDALLSHWLLGIHRIRMDVDNPLAWDIGWLAAFGVIPLAVAWSLRRRPRQGSGGGGRVLAVLVATTLVAGLVGALPLRSDGADVITVVMRPNQDIGTMLQAAADASGGIIWSDPTGQVWVLRAPSGELSALSLYRHGALYVSTTLGAATCGSWVVANT